MNAATAIGKFSDFLISAMPSTTEAKLAELGLTLPPMPATLASYIPCVRSGNMLYTAGHIAFKDFETKAVHSGKVGKDLTVEEAAELAKLIGLELMATIKNEVGDLDKVKRIVKIVGFVNCADDFTLHPEVINGCSNLVRPPVSRSHDLSLRHRRPAPSISSCLPCWLHPC